MLLLQLSRIIFYTLSTLKNSYPHTPIQYVDNYFFYG